VTRAAAIAIVAWLVALPARAQLSSGELRLAVTDATGLPVAASGILTSDSSQLERRFATDAGGRVVFDRLPFGVYKIAAGAAGFVAQSRVVEVRSSVPREVQLTLPLAPIAAAVDVTPHSTLLDLHRVGVSYDLAARQLREQAPSTPGRELLDLVSAQPGWLMESNGVLHPRGSEYQTLFVVDGVPMEDNRSPAFAPEPPDGAVEAVSIITGAFPAEYGRKLGGMIDVTTSRDRQRGFHGSLDIGGGTFATATGFGLASYSWNRHSLTANAGGARTARYLDPPTAANDNNTGRLGSTGLAYDGRPSTRDRLQFAVRESFASFGAPNDFVQEAAGQRQDRRNREHLAQAAWSRVASPRVLFDVRATFADLSADLWSNANAIPILVSQQRGFTRSYAKGALSAELGAHDVRIGADIVHAPVREALDYQITDASFFSRQTPGSFSFVDRRTEQSAALFAQDTIRAGPFTASLGLRWDRYSLVVDDQELSPRLGLAWAPHSPSLVLRVAYDRAFQTPAVENLLLASSPAVDQLNRRVLRLPVPASRGHFLEAGVSAAPGGAARVDATLFRRTFVDFADDDVFLNTGISFPVAFRSADIHGAELKVTLPKWRSIGATLAYSYLLGRAELPATGGLFLGAEAAEALVADRIPISQDQHHTLRTRLRYQPTLRTWTAVAVRAGSGLPVAIDDGVDVADLAAHYGANVVDRVNFGEGRIAPNFAVDVVVGYEALRAGARRLEIKGEVLNATNRLNVVNFAGLFSGTAVGAPRSAGIRARFDF